MSLTRPCIGEAGTAACLFLLTMLAGSALADNESAARTGAAGSLAAAGVLSVGFLESSDAVIGEIRIDNGNVFDPDDPAEDGLLHRLFNAAHVRTRPAVIRRQLLIEPGDEFIARRVEECARLLRHNQYLTNAEIVPVAYRAGTVDLEVRTEDTWSLHPSLSFSRKGGRNTGGLGIKDTNLLGTGSAVEVGYHAGVDRDSLAFSWSDPQLGSSRFALELAAADNTDGGMLAARLEQPFYSLDTRHAGGVRLEGFDQTDSLYQLGEITDDLGHRSRRAEVWYGWSDGLRDGHATRWLAGLALDQQRFSPAVDDGLLPGDTPPDRRLIYPFLGFEWLEDRYETTRNADRIGRVEDRHIGGRVAARLGYASPALGSDAAAWIASLSAGRGFHPNRAGTLLLDASLDGRLSDGAGDSYLLAAGLRYYHRHSPHRLSFAEFRTSAGDGVDPEMLISLGGDTGLRAYPLRYQTGGASALLTLEERFFTDWYPFHLFRVGGAVFFDAGQVWDLRDGTDADQGLLTDVGVGLRIGSPLSSSGRMIHIDLAYPLDGPPAQRGPQLVIETHKHF
jgi:hypothetical protein